MTSRLQYIAGLTFIIWGLMLITPLYLNFILSEAFIVIPVICLFLLTGLTIMRGKKYSWTLGLILGTVLIVHFVISTLNKTFQVTDMVRQHKPLEIILFVIWTILTLLTLYSVWSFLSKEVKTKMDIESSQYRWTLIASAVTGILLTIFLLEDWYWI